ncbi:hypothetical protein CA85_31150 [Allorhodopirellula solitaria]|uniref:Uncharacterized protein n=1 Tax=Allorhodopirellula solitaria TaxID=2527987 RepID=A0A5C5XT73_9BACT|nr:hypothetical protein CA85_31150 [Allorhodopirellula solitaria]
MAGRNRPYDDMQLPPRIRRGNQRPRLPRRNPNRIIGSLASRAGSHRPSTPPHPPPPNQPTHMAGGNRPYDDMRLPPRIRRGNHRPRSPRRNPNRKIGSLASRAGSHRPSTPTHPPPPNQPTHTAGRNTPDVNVLLPPRIRRGNQRPRSPRRYPNRVIGSLASRAGSHRPSTPTHPPPPNQPTQTAGRNRPDVKQPMHHE